MKAKAKRSSAQGTPRKEAEKRQRKADEKNAAAASRERRRLDRRNTDDRVDRLLAQKLYPRFPRELIEGTIAEDGSTPRSMIAEEVRRSKTTNNYLKQEFWTQFFLKFPFEDGLACVVPEPLGNAEIRPEVLEAIAPLHCGNPASRTAINLVTYLESAVDLNERELYGIAMAAQQTCTVTKDMHRRSMSAFLRYTQRTCANERYPRLFDPLLPVLSHLLMEMFSERRKLPPPNWIRTHFDAISLYMDRTHLEECVDAMQRGEQPSDAALEGVLSTPLGAHLFFCFRDKKLMGDFIRSVTKRLDDLVHMDFAEDEVKAFRSVMEKEAAPLQSTVLGPYTVVKHEVTFLGCELNVEMRGTLGVWSKHFSARVKDIGTQTRQCPLLPWEELLYSDAEVPGAPTTITLPADLLSKIRNVRDAARAMFGSGTLTLIEMQRTMNANQRELLECDEHFDLELNFLNNKADALISTRLRQTVMDALPSEKHHVTLASAVAVIDKIDQGPVCAAGNATARGQVAGILNMLRNFADGRPIDSKLLNTADPFFAACHCRMVYFATTYYDSKCQDDRDSARAQAPLVGKTALSYRFSRALKKEKNSEPITLKDLELLRQYQAFLTPHQKGVLDRWVTQCISVALHAFKRIRDGDPPDTVERALVPATTSVGSSAASSSDMLVASIAASATSLRAAGTRPKGNAVALGTETKDQLMKFFSKKQR